jgi:hypothetical protein
MPDLNKPIWAEMQEIKANAYEAGEMHVALFWQNEQIMKKMSDILFAMKERNV